jgi:dihydrofolate reductase
MRKIVMFNRVSADGYFSRPDGNLDWVIPDEDIDKGAAGSLSDAGTILFGRRTYDMFESFWPTAVDDSPTSPVPHGSGARSPEMRAMGVWINEATKIVFSRTRKEVTWQGSRLVHELDPREVEAWKRQPGKAMMIFGSGSLVTQLTRHGLIDEYQLIVSPILLGAGASWLAGLATSVRLELAEVKAYKAGNVMLRYARST